MKKMFVALITAALTTVSANAAVTITSNIQTAANGGLAASAATPAGSVSFDFDALAYPLTGSLNGFTLSNNNSLFSILPDKVTTTRGTGMTTSQPTGDTTGYLAVFSGGYQQFLGAQAFNTLSLFWGTPDGYNSIDLLGQDGSTLATVSGGDIPGLAAVGSSAAAVTLTASQSIYGARFNSSTNSFELDNVRFSNAAAGTTSAVPEPASWAMMIVGFGAVGFAARRRPSGRTLPQIG